MVLKNKFYNIDFNKNINITDNRNNLISKIDETIKNFPGLKILNDSKLLEESINAANNFIKFNIGEEVHTMNMYNRIYIPENYRFFFPIEDNEFIMQFYLPSK